MSGLYSADYPGLGRSYNRKTLTFSNDSGTVNLFTVTGAVIVKVIARCTTNVASAAAGNVEVGVAGSTDAMIPATLATDIDAGEIWQDASPDSDIEALTEAMRSYIIVGGADIIMTLSAQIDSGVIAFDCFWTQLSDDGLVVAA